MATLDAHRSINPDMEETRYTVSAGHRVQAVSDNAPYWSIATMMRSDNEALSSVLGALAFGDGQAGTAGGGLSTAIDVITERKARMVAARMRGVNRLKVN